MNRLSVTLLGGFTARLDTGEPLALRAKKAQAMLAYLASAPGHGHGRDALASLLWGGIDERSARASLRQAIFAVRRALGVAGRRVLIVDGDHVALDAAAVDVDVATFERLVAEGTPAALEAACVAYRGELLAGVVVDEAPFEEWLLAERERLRELALETLTRLLALQQRAGSAAAVQTALKLLTADPLQEGVHRTLMRLYAAQGRRGAALRQYQLCVGTLRRELGAEPEPETRALYQDILRQRPERVPPGAPGLSETTVARDCTEPFVGRESERARLRRLLGDAAMGRGHVVAVVGEAGIGKSRLVSVFLRDDAAAADARVVIGSSYENEQILAFGPWVDAFRSAGVTARDEAVGALKAVWRAELTRLLPELDVPGLPRAGDDYLRLFESVAQLLEGLGARRTLLVVLEDLHWADEMSVRLLAFLARRLGQARVLVVATVRGEELADAAIVRRTLEDLERQRRLTRLALCRLSLDDTTALVARLGPVAAEATELATLGRRVWSATEGHPLMVVETLRARAEGSEDDDPRSLPVPERVRRVIAARLERLSDASRHLADVASVIGRDFEYALLEGAARVETEQAAAALEGLVSRRVMHGVGDRFQFTHDRIRETVYAMLPLPRRRLLHGHVGRALEALRGEDGAHAAALGQHWLHAEVWDKAYACLRRAGTAASAQSAYREAATCFEHALRALEHLPRDGAWAERGIDVRFDLQNALVALGAPERTERRLREAQALAESLGDRSRLARALAYLATNFRRLSDHDRALESARRALDLARAESDFATQVLATSFLGHTYETMGEYRLALEVLTDNVAALPGPLSRERFGGPGTPAVSSRCRLALCLAERGEFVNALARATEAVELAEGVGRPLDACDAAFAEAFVHLRQGTLEQALAASQRGRVLGEERDLPVEVALLESERGYVSALGGRVDDAVCVLEQASHDIESTGLRLRDALRATWLAEAYLLGGRIDDATDAGNRALDLARMHKERGVEAWAHRLLAEIAARRDPPGVAEAEAHYRAALTLAGELGMRPLRAHCVAGLARLHLRTAKAAQTADEMAEALAAFRALQMDRWIPLVLDAAAAGA